MLATHHLGCCQDDWYDETYFCSQYVDETAVFPEIGGCKYDFPMGDCMDIDVDVSETVRGCASELETHMTEKVRSVKIVSGAMVTWTFLVKQWRKRFRG